MNLISFFDVLIGTLVGIHATMSDSTPDLCHLSSCKPKESELLSRLCLGQDVRQDGRCCVNFGAAKELPTVVGLDLSDCALTNMKILENDIQAENATFQRRNISFIGAYENPAVSCNVDLSGMIQLETLWWPSQCSCPGGNLSWTVVAKNFPPDLDVNDTYCYGQEDICKQTKVVCPADSQCVQDGPGRVMCDCEKSWHGYKCLRQGDFPLVVFFVSISAGTAVLGGLLWTLCRRKVQKQD